MSGSERKADVQMSPILLLLGLLLLGLLLLWLLLLRLVDHEVPGVIVAWVLLPVAGEILDRGERAVKC
jgi:hypothetical protein